MENTGAMKEKMDEFRGKKFASVDDVGEFVTQLLKDKAEFGCKIWNNFLNGKYNFYTSYIYIYSFIADFFDKNYLYVFLFSMKIQRILVCHTKMMPNLVSKMRKHYSNQLCWWLKK